MSNKIEKLWNFINDSADEFYELNVVSHPTTHNFKAQARWKEMTIEGQWRGTINEALESLTVEIDKYPEN